MKKTIEFPKGFLFISGRFSWGRWIIGVETEQIFPREWFITIFFLCFALNIKLTWHKAHIWAEQEKRRILALADEQAKITKKHLWEKDHGKKRP